MKNKSTSFLDFHLWIKNGYEREWIMTLPIKEMVDWWSPRRCHWISDDGSTEPLTNQLMRTTHYPPGRAGANVGEGVKRPIGYPPPPPPPPPPLPATPDQCIDRNDRNWLRSQKAFNSIGNSDQWLLSPFQPPPSFPHSFRWIHSPWWGWRHRIPRTWRTQFSTNTSRPDTSVLCK